MSDPRIVCAVLAAGGSTRLGTPKQLLEVDGVPLLRRTVEAVSASGCSAIGVVLGAEADAIAAALAGLTVTQLSNPDWTRGLSSSLQVAVDWADIAGADALLVCVCDQPHLRAAHLARLCAAYRTTHGKVASGYANVRGVPAVFDRRDFAALRALRGDRGAGSLLSAEDVTVIGWPEGQVDLDTREDVVRFTQAARGPTGRHE
jgi:xanthine dehydrogenase accessory factor